MDLSTQQAWLMQNGKVTYGPVKISSGGPGEETPVGTFKVQWKDRNHVSTEVAGAPMPYSTFFAPGGVAFHGGSVTRASAGCVHLDTKDAIVFYDTLKIGDEVQVRTDATTGPTDTSKPTPEPSAQSSTQSGTKSSDKPAAERHHKSSTPSSSNLAAPIL